MKQHPDQTIEDVRRKFKAFPFFGGHLPVPDEKDVHVGFWLDGKFYIHLNKKTHRLRFEVESEEKAVLVIEKHGE